MDLRGALGTGITAVQNNFWPNFKGRSTASLVDTRGYDTRHYRVTAGDHDEAYICCPCLSSLPSLLGRYLLCPEDALNYHKQVTCGRISSVITCPKRSTGR